MGDFFGGLLKFQIFSGVLEIPYIFEGWRVDNGPSLRMMKNGEYPPPLGILLGISFNI